MIFIEVIVPFRPLFCFRDSKFSDHYSVKSSDLFSTISLTVRFSRDKTRIDFLSNKIMGILPRRVVQ